MPPQTTSTLGLARLSAIVLPATIVGAVVVFIVPLPPLVLDLLLSVDTEIWKQEAGLIPEYFAQFGTHLPQAMTEEHAKLVERLNA